MPRTRQPYRLDPHDYSMQLSGLPKLLDLIPDWHAEARCAEEPDPEMVDRAFFTETKLFSQNDPVHLASPSTTFAMLLCSDCSVRRECLRAAIDPPAWAVREDDLGTLGAQERAHRTFGTWGGTTELERRLVEDLPTDEALAILMDTFSERLERRLELYWESRTRLRPTPTGRLRPRRAGKRDKRIDELLAARRMKRFHLRGPGPGRGHKGPIALYAERHGVSRSTAWRRLRAAA